MYEYTHAPKAMFDSSSQLNCVTLPVNPHKWCDSTRTVGPDARPQSYLQCNWSPPAQRRIGLSEPTALLSPHRLIPHELAVTYIEIASIVVLELGLNPDVELGDEGALITTESTFKERKHSVQG